MRVGVIIPTRGARPNLLARTLYYLERQTWKANIVRVVDHPPKNVHHDITERYRMGLEELAPKCDVIFFMEDDDYYPANYIEQMCSFYRIYKNPLVFGIGETYFYHPIHQAYWHLKHPKRACAYSMLVNPI